MLVVSVMRVQALTVVWSNELTVD